MSNENYNNEPENDIVTITLEDGGELVCDVITIFSCQGKQYIALLPQNAEGEAEVYLYEFIEKDGDNIDLINIESDEEFDAVSDAFDEWLEAEEYGDMMVDASEFE